MEAEELAQAHEQMIASYQKVTTDAQAQFEAMVAKAQADLAKLVASANAQVDSAPAPVKPAAQWVRSNDEQVLVLNKAAAEFFSAIFDQIGGVAVELAKLAKK